MPFLRRDESSDSLCGLCDDVMEHLLRGTEGIQAVPCSWLCLRIPMCMNMCQSIQESAETSSKFPCSAAGYCADLSATEGEAAAMMLAGGAQVECQRGPLWSCEPKQFCRRQRRRLKYTCDFRPGMGRWVGVQRAAASQTMALASGLIAQKRCGERGAGPYCIAEASGFGKVCEVVGGIMSVLWGGYQSLLAIETPGGDDDQQWLTFWVISVTALVLEHSFAKVLLSKFPLYYELKLVLLMWLMFFDGANQIYRWLRRKLIDSSSFFSRKLFAQHGAAARMQLQSLLEIGGQVLMRQKKDFEVRLKQNPSTRNPLIMKLHTDTARAYLDTRGSVGRVPAKTKYDECWEYDYTDRRQATMTLEAAEMLYLLSKWILSVEGIQEIDKCKQKKQLDDDAVAMLMERASTVVSFQPRYLYVHLIGTQPGSNGRLPVMDRNGKADCYIKCRLVSVRLPSGTNDQTSTASQPQPYLEQGIKSRIVYRTLEPSWNETLEVGLRKGTIDAFGNYSSNSVARNTKLLLEAWDADVGLWGIAFEAFRFVILGLGVASFTGYVTGFVDSYSSPSWIWAFAAVHGFVALGLVVSYVLSGVLRADDEIIGRAEVPLEILLDQRDHPLLLKLQDPTSSNGKMLTRGERGILRVRLSLSE